MSPLLGRTDHAARTLPIATKTTVRAHTKVLLRDLQGWTMDEIAVYLGVPLGTIKSRLHRARLGVAERVGDRFRARWVPEAGPARSPEAAPC